MPEYLKQAEGPPVATSEAIRTKVTEMLATIEREGMDAVRRYSRDLDGWDPPSFRVGPAEIEAAGAALDNDLKLHIADAQRQIRTFAERQRETLTELDIELQPGVMLGHRHIPVDAVGAYVPSGRYPMLASAFMTILVPKVAGVSRVVGISAPWQSAGMHPAVLYSIVTSGADEIYCIGGVQALALLAFGGDGIAPVDMLVGAGNAYVTEAKRQLFGRVGIDLLAGPTEILVIADESASPELVAADLAGQAEHGPTSPAILVSLSRKLAVETMVELDRIAGELPTGDIVRAAWRDYGVVAVVSGRAEAIALANEYAPEHLEVQVLPTELDAYLADLRNYGSLFLGEQATVPYGDKAIGTNHVLPTSRAARYSGGLWVGKFLKTVTYQRLTPDGARRVAPVAAAISDAEHFPGHALSARKRLERFGTRDFRRSD